ncbi:hypothetical protein NM688_g8434 [Phlebia brevispora]|uniref:Uncharacterized protein n=1 Tax=Phlebia brevispora TaxID=194682 RepID=A0ACC1RT67_9APHY|nr:hypothetical protein NM688_g8434 [Phlebia brevispora]
MLSTNSVLSSLYVDTATFTIVKTWEVLIPYRDKTSAHARHDASPIDIKSMNTIQRTTTPQRTLGPSPSHAPRASQNSVDATAVVYKVYAPAVLAQCPLCTTGDCSAKNAVRSACSESADISNTASTVDATASTVISIISTIVHSVTAKTADTVSTIGTDRIKRKDGASSSCASWDCADIHMAAPIQHRTLTTNDTGVPQQRFRVVRKKLVVLIVHAAGFALSSKFAFIPAVVGDPAPSARIPQCSIRRVAAYAVQSAYFLVQSDKVSSSADIHAEFLEYRQKSANFRHGELFVSPIDTAPEIVGVALLDQGVHDLCFLRVGF